MRWFIVFLIVANVILFFWVQHESRPSSAEMRLPPPDVGRLRLLTEMRPSASADEAGQVEPAEATSPDPVAPLPATTASSVAQVAAKADVAVEAVSAPGGKKEAFRSPLVTPDAEDTQTEADSVAGVDGSADGEQGDAVQGLPAVAGAVGAVPAPAPACARVGPFAPDDADELISRLPPNMVLLSDLAEEYTRVERYYVIIPPLPSGAEGQKMMKQLADAGVTDTWLFRRGEYRNGISLGFFSRKGGAQQRSRNIAKKGFTTEIKEQTSVSERRWLLLKNRDGDDPGESLPLPAGIRAEKQACP